MASILEQIQIKYKSREVDKTHSQLKTSVTYQGSKELCEQFMEANPPGTVNAEFGTVEKLKLMQDEGPFWNVQVAYTINTSTSIHIGGHNTNGPEYSTLSMSALSMPIESHKNYKCKWNNNIFSTKTWSQMTTSERNAAQNIVDTAGRNAQGEIDDKIAGTSREYNGGSDFTNAFFAWGKSVSDCPSLNVPEGDPPQSWFVIGKMTKPGVDSFTYPCYTITEQSRNLNRDKAGWNLSKVAGHISAPQYGDFGLSKKFPDSNWLCEGGEISYDGSRYWITTRHYTMSPDTKYGGWDPLIYPSD